MTKPFFTGVCTAMVTPFISGAVNHPLLEVLLQRQVAAGIRGAVLSGTTGESAGLSDDEKLMLICHAKASVPEDFLILAGPGSNDTSHAIYLSQAAEDAGADGLLVVTPYYNKATPKGLIAHYEAIAAAVRIPIILYNVPTRTGVDIPVQVYKELSNVANIVGVKEACTDLGKIARIIRECPKDFCLWSGNDNLTVPIMALGGQGVISVASNIDPVRMEAMCSAALAGDFDTAADLQLKLLELMDGLFMEVNPIPVKEAMAMLGYDCGPCRLPLTPMAEENRKKLSDILLKL